MKKILSALFLAVLISFPAFAATKLSQINNGGALTPSTDQLVAVRSGTTDELVTPPAQLISSNSTLTFGGTATNPTVDIANLSANQILGALTNTFPTGLTIPSCSTSGSALKWTSGTGFSCNTSITASTLTGLTLGTSPVNLATLGTGIVKNTTTTGNLTNAAASDVIGLFSACSGTQYLGADGACHSGSGTVTSVTAGLGLGTAAGTCGSGSITTSGTISPCVSTTIKTSTYSVGNGDAGSLLVANSATAMSFNIPQATSSGNFANGWCVNFVNENSGIVTLTPTTSTIYGAPTVLGQGGWASICSDGTNYSGQGSAGNLVTAGVPVVSSCGSGTLVAGSNNNKGQISGVTAATACTITFSQALPAAPSCQFNTNAAIAPSIGTISTSAVTTTMTALTGTLYYACF